jgi:PPE-repeat protein
MSAFGDAAAVPPEANHTLMSTGDLGESLVAAAAGYESVADMLLAELAAMGVNTASTAVVAWQGPGGVMMEISAQEFIAVCAMASAWVRIGQVQAAEVASAHTTALESMIPAEACLGNRASQAGLVATNLLGQNTPAIIMLDGQYFGQFWTQNATARTGYGAVVASALAALAVPAPFAPTAADPAGPAVAAATDTAQSGGQGVLQASAKTLTQTADSPAASAMAGGPASAQGMMGQLAGQLGGVFGQVGSSFGQITQVGQQLPQMLGQAPSMFSGMLGPLSSSMNAGALAPSVSEGAVGAVPASVGGLGALGGAAGGGGSLTSGSAALSTTFVRPASSFSAPESPTLPAGWQEASGPEAAAATRPSGVGGGGLYGAPPGMGRDGTPESSDKPARTMQLTGRPGAEQGERRR